ncbi:hypothetical protein VTJ04DRAFT_94 [Mycothermus thermophilus]|uniref:uncharacterized protein n=1 Tax=Humicola insolens TaxID=85995 RepID=UPI003742F052
MKAGFGQVSMTPDSPDWAPEAIGPTGTVQLPKEDPLHGWKDGTGEWGSWKGGAGRDGKDVGAVSSHGASRQIYTDGQGLTHGTPAHTRHHHHHHHRLARLRTRRHGAAPTSLIQIACLSHVELADLEQSVHLRPSLALCPASAPASRTHSSTSRSWRIGAAPGQLFNAWSPETKTFQSRAVPPCSVASEGRTKKQPVRWQQQPHPPRRLPMSGKA